jgi:hypothetical protein
MPHRAFPPQTCAAASGPFCGELTVAHGTEYGPGKRLANVASRYPERSLAKVATSAFGTNLPIWDVRGSVANVGRSDMTQTAEFGRD